MASSPSALDFNEVETFDEYNPHPYQGGYDIALTYGSPLPPSFSICYPISASPPSSPRVLEPHNIPASSPVVSEPRPVPPAGDEPAFGSSSVGEDLYGVGGFRGSENGFRYGETEDNPEQSGYRAGDFEDGHGWRGSRDWDFVSCAADYLFEYLHTYGEKRDESYNYGNMNYAYERHKPQEPLLIQFNPDEPSWCERPGYHGHNQEEFYSYHGHAVSYGGDSSEVAHSGYAFSSNRESFEMTHSEIARVGSLPSLNSYHEDYSIQLYPQSEYSHASESHYYEEPLSVQHEEFEHAWSQKHSFSEFYESQVLTQPVEMHPCGGKLYEQPPLDMFDFIEKSWYHILNNNEFGEVNCHPQLKMHDDSSNQSEEQSYFPFHKYSDYDI